MIFFNTVESILSIVLIIVTGYICTAKGWFDEKSGKVFSLIITNIALPAYMIWNLMSTFTKERLVHLAPGLVVPFTSIAACFVVGYTVSKLIRIAPNRQGTFRSMFSLSNSVFIGLPVNLALFGEESIPFVLLYYIANTTLFWTVGVSGISNDGMSGQGKVPGATEVLRKIFSPPLLGFIVAILLIVLGVSLPHFVLDTCKYLGNLITPLSMIFIGIAIYGVKLKNVKFSKDMAAIILGRFIVAPLIVMGIAYMVPLPILMKKVFIIQAALPVMTLTAVIAKSYHADAEYAAVLTTVTTIGSIITIPVYMLIFQYYF